MSFFPAALPLLKCSRTAATLLLLLAACAIPLHAQTTTTNLLTNPGAESGSIAGWTAAGPGTPTVDSGTFDSGINPNTGSFDFLGHDGASDSLSQTVSLITQGITTASIDAGTIQANLSFFEQGLSQGTPSDDAFVTLTFLDASGAILKIRNSGEVDSHNGTWQNFTQTYSVPPNTRSITYTMNFLRHAGSDLDAFIDDNSLTLSNAGLSVMPAVLNFNNQTANTVSAPEIVTVTNPQSTPINILNISIQAGASPSEFAQTNTCPASLAPDTSCQITYTFTPHGVGAKTAGSEIDDDSGNPIHFVTLSGTGTGGILQVDPGNLKRIAGTGSPGYAGDEGPASRAQLNQPVGLAFDSHGNLYIADTANSVVRRVDAAGNMTTFAGNGTRGFSGDGQPASTAELSTPFSVAVDASDNVFIQDTGNDVIRKVDANGIISTIAGTPGTPGHAGDGGPATQARFNQNQGGRFDPQGNFFVPQCLGSSVRKITPAGTISTVAGTFVAGFSGDGGPANAAQLSCPSGAATDSAGNLYIADEFNNRIRKVNAAGTISTIAGDGIGAFKGDGGPALTAELNLPNDVVVDASGNLYIADSGNNRIRKIDPSGTITTVAGGLDNAGSAGVNSPLCVTTDVSGNVFFCDSGNSNIQQVFPAGLVPFPPTPVGTHTAAQAFSLSNIGNIVVTIPTSNAFALTGTNPGDFSFTGGTCLAGFALQTSASSCTLQLSFSPTAIGLRTARVSVTDDALNSPQSFTVSGNGLPGTPTLTWAPPASIPFGTPLGPAQLDAFASGPTDTTLNGTYTYTPPAGTILPQGTSTLSVSFTANDPNYLAAPVTATVPITVTAGNPIPTITLTGPSTAPPGSQPAITFTVVNPYPYDLTATFDLTFASASNPPVDDPAIQFAAGGRTLTFTVTANTTATPPIQLQAGTVAGTITVPVVLTANSLNVTPTTLAPVVIVIPAAAPVISTATITRSGAQLSVAIHGFSNTREVTQATFHFTAAPGDTVDTPDIPAQVGPLFTTWYTGPQSAAFGSTFTYTQIFNTTDDATHIGSVQVTLTNSAGPSQPQTAQ